MKVCPAPACFPDRVALAIFLIAALHLSSQVASPATAAQDVRQTETLSRETAISIAARIVEAAPQLAKIWPGYWPPEQPFIIYLPGAGALLVSAGERPDSFQPLQDTDLPDPLVGRAFWHSGSLPDVGRPFVIDYPIASERTGILVNAAEADAKRIVTLLLHEQFHGYQKRAFKGGVSAQFVDPLAIKDRVAFAASAETERRILAKAIDVEDASDRRLLLQQYFALRREREAAMPAQEVGVERGFEHREGTAKYVDLAGHATIDGGRDRLKSLLVAELRKSLASATGAFATHWFRSRSYGNGAAITYLISRLDRGNWQAKIEGGAMLDELLESLVRKPAPGAKAGLAESARLSFASNAIQRELEPVIRAGEKAEIKSVQEFLAGAPYRLVLDATAAGTGSTGFNAPNMAQLGPATMVLPKAIMFSFSAPSVSLAATNLPVLMEDRRYTVLTPSAPRIVGLSATEVGDHRLESAMIRGNGIDLKVDRPVVVTVTKTSMFIRVADR